MGVPCRLGGEPFEWRISVERVTSSRFGAFGICTTFWWSIQHIRLEKEKQTLRDYFTLHVIHQNHTYSPSLKSIRTGEKNQPQQ